MSPRLSPCPSGRPSAQETPALVVAMAREAFSDSAARAGISIEGMLAERARTATLLKRLPTLAEVAEFAVFVASDRASAMTGAIANLTCGSLVD
jgi:3-oxoacyl-[acyl-carrier protein] reductase